MLKIRIVSVGKHKGRWVAEGCAHFEKLLSRYARVEWVFVPAVRESPSLPAAQIKRKEAVRLKKELGKGTTIALADSGKKMDSRTFASFLERLQVTGGGTVSFVIGGPCGLDRTTLTAADHVISLSELTFSHQIARLVLLEQLFRAFSILRGTDYHK